VEFILKLYLSEKKIFLYPVYKILSISISSINFHNKFIEKNLEGGIHGNNKENKV